MSNYDLDRIKAKEQSAFQRKQEAWAVYDAAKTRASEAHDVMMSAWLERCEARNEMNREYQAIKTANDHYREVWDNYCKARDYTNSLIEPLRAKADLEHQRMKVCFDQASSEYELGDKANAAALSREGHEHKKRRNELNAEISELCHKIRAAKEEAKLEAPKTDGSVYRAAKAKFEEKKSIHAKAEAEFKRLKGERDRLKNEFMSTENEYNRIKENLQDEIAEAKAESDKNRKRKTPSDVRKWPFKLVQFSSRKTS